jgi:hypothetical protein
MNPTGGGKIAESGLPRESKIAEPATAGSQFADKVSSVMLGLVPSV